MRNLLDIGVEMQTHEQTLNDTSQKIGQGEEIVSNITHFAC